MSVAGADGPDDCLPSPAVERVRLRVLNGSGPRVIPGEPLRDDEVAAGEAIEYDPNIERPRTRAECIDMPRPCPFVSCRHHLYLDINPETGAIKLNFPHLDVWEMAETCSLDVADRGRLTLGEVGKRLNVTRERARQVETAALRHADQKSNGELGVPPERG